MMLCALEKNVASEFLWNHIGEILHLTIYSWVFWGRGRGYDLMSFYLELV